MSKEKCYTTQDVADILGKSIRTIQNWITTGKLNAIKQKRIIERYQWLIPESELKKFDRKDGE